LLSGDGGHEETSREGNGPFSHATGIATRRQANVGTTQAWQTRWNMRSPGEAIARWKEPIRYWASIGLFRGAELVNARGTRPRRTFFETTDFPWIRTLEDNWLVIRGELDRLMRRMDLIPRYQSIQVEAQSITNDARWKTFVLYGYGARSAENCWRCPETDRLLRVIPGMTSAMFSILRGPKHVPAHRGPFNGVLRYHLGLRVPAPCRIRVGNDVRSWQEGKSLVFDDTNMHEAWNDGPGDRVVLFVDFLRPSGPATRAMNERMVRWIRSSEFIQGAVKRLDRFEQERGHLLDEALAQPDASDTIPQSDARLDWLKWRRRP
jgi:ornithine lipid ester-linked acyl 2-hydroxylase